MLQTAVQSVARSQPKWRFVLLSKQLRTLNQLFRTGNVRIRLSAINGLFTEQIQRTPARPDPEFRETTYTSRQVDVNWSRDSWNEAMWLDDFINERIDPLNIDDLTIDSLQYMVRGDDILSLGGRYQLLKLTFTTWSLKPGIFERLKTDSVSMPNLWLYELFKRVKEDMRDSGQLTPESEKRIRDTFLVLSEISPNQPVDVMMNEEAMEELQPGRDVALFLRDDEVNMPLRELRQ